MRIQVRRSGGFAGIARRGEVDTSGRPDASEWESLAEAALAAGRDGPPAGVPDGFHYRITVGDRTVDCADPRLTQEQRTLISRVLGEGA
ncbi:protealysin inhibitor emfourin [Streptomyces sp. NPDC057428]|uniref:protealysin inhibitor emfourin n=1 Tax=Streptomyces sp. NPDC057428 TaxID=3346129 RepID=UPI00367D3822